MEENMDIIIREIMIDDVDEITELYIETYKQKPYIQRRGK